MRWLLFPLTSVSFGLLLPTACGLDSAQSEPTAPIAATEAGTTPAPDVVTPGLGSRFITVPGTSQRDLRSFYLAKARDRDGIPAILQPRFLSVREADHQMVDDELVIGVSINGEYHAYSVPFLSDHEVVNDTVGGRAIAVTW